VRLPRRPSGGVRPSAAADSVRGTSARSASATDPLRVAELTDLLREITEVSLATGPRGVVRAGQALAAVGDVTQALVSGETLAPPVILRMLFEKLGATYIKLGQFVASSPTIFPEEFVLEFQKCLDATEPTPFSEVRATLQADLRRPISEVFSEIDPVPLASASVAQVHRAVLASSGQEVVVKVLKPGVEDVLTADLNFIYLAAKVLEFLNPELERTSFAGIVADIRSSMMDEVDFVKEAENIAQFRGYLDRMDIAAATAPFVYRQFSSRRVLVMERFRGVPLTDLEAIRVYSQGDPEATLITALNTWLGSVLACESFHADVHAGNLLVLQDGRVAFIDFGIVGRISPGTWGAVQAFLTATAEADYLTMAQALVQMGATSEEVNLEAFAADLRTLYDGLNELDTQVVVGSSDGGETVSAGVVVDEAQVNRLVLDVVRVGETHGLKFPREFSLLTRTLLYMDRYVRLLAPELGNATNALADERVDFATRARATPPPTQPQR